MRKIAAVASVAFAALALSVPAASATETGVPAGDLDGCTTVLLGEAGGWVPTAFPSDPVTVTYTPPATVTVNADRAVGMVTYVVTNVSGDVIAYVECVV